MKICPVCQSSYSDDTLKFCLVDGTRLDSDQGAGETLVMPELETIRFTDRTTEVSKLADTVSDLKSQDTIASSFHPIPHSNSPLTSQTKTNRGLIYLSIASVLVICTFIGGIMIAFSWGVWKTDEEPSIKPIAEKKSINKSNCDLPATNNLVSDSAQVLDNKSKIKLENRLKQLRKSGEIEFTVVTVRTTGDKQIFNYTKDLGNCWGIGSSTPDGAGMLLLVAVEDRRWRIEATESMGRTIANDEFTNWGAPMGESFREGRYADGTLIYVETIINALEERRDFSIDEN